jgi:hypothetical protein|tara:strand:- start:2630 stop:2851 length:222 start_codon:yes stop_codon:yes gene_type:complete
MEGDSREIIKKTKTKVSYVEYDDSSIFQPSWVRHNTVLAGENNWRSVARQFRYVLYCGGILWVLHLIAISIFS